MIWLLDTNIVSEWVKPRPNPDVAAWLTALDEDDAYLSVITLGELRHGIARLAAGRRRAQLDDWLRVDLRARFDDRILPVNDAVADEWGVIVARREAAGRPIGSMDAFMAATANVGHLTLVTRNVNDFASAANAVFNPWAGDDR